LLDKFRALWYSGVMKRSGYKNLKGKPKTENLNSVFFIAGTQIAILTEKLLRSGYFIAAGYCISHPAYSTMAGSIIKKG